MYPETRAFAARRERHENAAAKAARTPSKKIEKAAAVTTAEAIETWRTGIVGAFDAAEHALDSGDATDAAGAFEAIKYARANTVDLAATAGQRDYDGCRESMTALRTLNIDDLTPMEAVATLHELQRLARNGR